jgi:hypothetical protein
VTGGEALRQITERDSRTANGEEERQDAMENARNARFSKTGVPGAVAFLFS